METTRSQLVERLCVCPQCGGSLEWGDLIACTRCGAAYPREQGRPKFHDIKFDVTPDAAFQSNEMLNANFTAKLLNAGKRIVNSEHLQRNHVTEALAAAPANGVIVELGSGARRLRDDVINVDLFPFAAVDVLADIARTPLPDESTDLVVLDTVIEHVPEAHRVIDETFRILKPGGKAVCISPFIFPYHGYPKHYCNFSKDGLEHLFRHFSSCEVDTNIGPTCALTNLVSEYVAVASSRGNPLLYVAAKGVALLPLLPLKYLDELWGRSSLGTRMASLLGVMATK